MLAFMKRHNCASLKVSFKKKGQRFNTAVKLGSRGRNAFFPLLLQVLYACCFHQSRIFSGLIMLNTNAVKVACINFVS